MVTKIQFLWTTSLTLMGYAALELIGAGVMFSFCLILIATGWFDSLDFKSDYEETEEDPMWDDPRERITYVRAGHWFDHESELANGGSMKIDAIHGTYIQRWETYPEKAIEATRKMAQVDHPSGRLHVIEIQEAEKGRIHSDGWVSV